MRSIQSLFFWVAFCLTWTLDSECKFSFYETLTAINFSWTLLQWTEDVSEHSCRTLCVCVHVCVCFCEHISMCACVSTRMGCFGSVRFHRVNICTVLWDLKKGNLFEYLWMWSNKISLLRKHVTALSPPLTHTRAHADWNAETLHWYQLIKFIDIAKGIQAETWFGDPPVFWVFWFWTLSVVGFWFDTTNRSAGSGELGWMSVETKWFDKK